MSTVTTAPTQKKIDREKRVVAFLKWLNENPEAKLQTYARDMTLDRNNIFNDKVVQAMFVVWRVKV